MVELEWSQPTQTYGDVLGYRIRYGIKNQTLKEEYIPGNRQHTYKITDLGKLYTHTHTLTRAMREIV